MDNVTNRKMRFPNSAVILAVTTASTTASQSSTASSNGGNTTGPCYNTTPTPNDYYAASPIKVTCNLAIKVSF